MSVPNTVKILTYESWLTRAAWFRYATNHPDLVPCALVDRSACQEPFLDVLEPEIGKRRPLISGICRGFQPSLGQRILYLTRLCPEAKHLYAPGADWPVYMASALLEVSRVYENHDAAAITFDPGHYISMEKKTPFPPNIIPYSIPPSPMPQESCVVYVGDRAYLGVDVSISDYSGSVEHYHKRAQGFGGFKRKREQLRVAETIALAAWTSPEEAPIISKVLWNPKQMNCMGLWVPAKKVTEALKAWISTL